MSDVNTTQENVQVEQNQVEVLNSYQTAIKNLLANGAKRINGLKIKNINCSEKDNYTMVSFTLTSPIRGYVSNDNGLTFEEGLTNIVYTSLYGIVGALKEDENLSWMSSFLLDKPDILKLVLNGATVDVIQQDVPQGTEFINPFTTRTDTVSQVYDHDIIINHIIKFKLSKTGEKMADKLADKVLGF